MEIVWAVVSKLAKHPTVCQMVKENDRIAIVMCFADSPESGPQAIPGCWAIDRAYGSRVGNIPNLKLYINGLHIILFPREGIITNIAVRVCGRATIGGDSFKTG